MSRYPADKSLSDYASQVLSESERLLYRVAVSCSPDCTVIVDNKVMPFPESANSVVFLDPGLHALIAGWSNNRHKNADVTAIAGGANRLSFVAPPLEKPAAPPVDPASPPTGTDPGRAAGRGHGSRKAQEIRFAADGLLRGRRCNRHPRWRHDLEWHRHDEQSGHRTGRERVSCGAAHHQLPHLPARARSRAAHEHPHSTTSVVGVTTAVIGLFFTNWGGDEAPKSDKKDAFLLPIDRG